MGRCAHAPAGRGARHLRRALVRDAPARHDRHAVRRRSRRTSRRGPADARQILREAALALDSRLLDGESRARGVRRACASLPAGEGESVQRPPRDRLHARAGGHAERRRREADDVPAHRARGARRASGATSACIGSTRVRGRCPGRPGSTASRFPSSSSQTSARTCSTCTEASRPRSSRARATIPALLERVHPDGPDIAAQVRLRGDTRVGANGGRRRPAPDDPVLPRPRGRRDDGACIGAALPLGDHAIDPALEERPADRAHRVRVLLDRGQKPRRAI